MIFLEALLWNFGMILLGMLAIATSLILLGILSEILVGAFALLSPA